MEEILDLYHRPYDRRSPWVCMDEKLIQLIRETRIPIPAKPGKPQRYDYEYERNDTAVNFLFTEPLTGWRKVNVRSRKTGVDWAFEIKELLDVDYPDLPVRVARTQTGAEIVIVVCDNLNTHTIASLYEAFQPAEARRLARRLELRHTPKHGSWLNIAEIELSILSQQCLDARIPDIETLGMETKAWEQTRNDNQKAVDWRFTTDEARIKLKRLHPQF